MNSETTENYEDVELVEDNNALQKIESDMINSDSFVNQPQSLEGSLFAEVHINEIKKLERLLEDSDNQKCVLSQRLNDTQSILDKTQQDLENQKNKIDEIFEKLKNMNFEEDDDENLDPEIKHLKQLVKSKLSKLDPENYKKELESLRVALGEYQQKIKSYENDQEVLTTMLNEFYSNYNQTFEELTITSEELASIYHHLCLSMIIW